MLIFDAHLDLSLDALEYNRDLRRSISEIRDREKGLRDKQGRENGTVCFSEMRRAGVGICVATQIARHVKPGNPLPGWHSPEQAWAQTQGQLAWYRAMEDAGHLIQITDRKGLDAQWEVWKTGEAPADAPIGYILSLEGADSFVTLPHLERACAQGLRAVGPAHYGPGTYAHGTDASGGLGVRGRELLREMDRLGMILDATHLCDESFWEALDHFDGPIWARKSKRKEKERSCGRASIGTAASSAATPRWVCLVRERRAVFGSNIRRAVTSGAAVRTNSKPLV